MPTTEERRVRSLARVAHALSRPRPFTLMLETACEEARVALDSACVSVNRIEAGTFTVRTLVNVGDLGPTTQSWPEDETYAIDEFSNLRQLVDWQLSWAVAVDDPESDPREVRLLRELGKGSAVGAPIVVDGQLWGMFYASRPPGGTAYGPDEMAYLEALAAIMSGALWRAQREESLNQLAYHDSLTGLPNRRALDERAALGFQVPAGTCRDVTAVVVDINGLKRVNDTMGHLAGDQLIKAVGGSLQRAFGVLPGALVARVGGDEFVVLSVGHDVRRVLEVADAVCGLTWDFGTVADVSCGAATVTITDATTVAPHELLAAADRAQYDAKHGRLRRTLLADTVPPADAAAAGVS